MNVIKGLSLSLLAIFFVGTGQASAKDQLVIGISQYPSNFHPLIESMMSKQVLHGMVRRPLMAYDADWRPICMMCGQIPSRENGTIIQETRDDGTKGLAITYRLLEEAVWGDGTPVTTEDILFTWEAGKHPESGLNNRELFAKDIVDITIHDSKKFTLHLEKEMCDAENMTAFRILPAHLERKVFERNPSEYRHQSLFERDPTNPGLNAGPYNISKVVTGSHIILEKNPRWWGKKPYFNKIIIRAIENTAAMEAALLAGEIDMINGEIGIPTDQALGLQKRTKDRFSFVFKPGLFYEHIDLRLDHEALQNKQVRHALIHAIDRTAISQRLFEGVQPVAHTNTHPLDSIYVDDVPKYDYDLEKARSLLKKSGWGPGGKKLSLILQTTAGDRTRELVEQVLQSSWKELGIDVRIQNQPARVLFGQTLTERKFDSMVMFAWISSPRNLPRTTLHSTLIPSQDNAFTGQNYTGYQSEKMDQILDDLQVMCTAEDQDRLWRQMQHLYAEDLPAIPLYFRATPFVMPKWLKGVRPTGHQFPSTLWVEQWHVAD